MLGIVYKLRCKDDNVKEFYIGSSINIKDRMINHKSDCNNPNSLKYNYKVYQYIRSNGGWFNWAYTILEECDVEDKDDLVLNYERKYQLELNPQLNRKVEGRTRAEYYRDNIEKMTEYHKKYKQENKDKIKKYRQDNKEYIQEYHKEYNKYYREINKETISINKKEYSERNSMKIKCECGSMVRKSNLTRHKKQQRHLSKLNLFQSTTII